MGTTNSENRTVQGGAALPVHITNNQMPGQSSDGVQVTRQEVYSTVVSGELQGSTSALQLPDVACKLAKLKALISNVGNVYIGPSGVSKPNGTTDTSSGLELAPGDETGWLPIDNLSRLYRICDNAGDDLTYLVLR